MLRLLTTRQVMKLVGVSYPTLAKFRRYEMCPLPFGRTGRSYTYEEAEVRAWLKANALLDPERPIRNKLDHERRSVATVAGTCRSEETT